MKYDINIIPENENEYVSFNLHKMTPHISEIISALEDEITPSYLMGHVEDTYYKIAHTDILYIESVDRKVFIYTKANHYEINDRLYILEDRLSSADFIRVSKSMLVNADKIKSFAPKMSGNLEATLNNNEKVLISRRYVKSLKQHLGMERTSL